MQRKKVNKMKTNIIALTQKGFTQIRSKFRWCMFRL